MLLARVALATNINVASLFQAFTLICRELRNVVKHAFLVVIFWDNKLLVIIFTLLATMVPCQEQQDCKWQTKKMQGSQAGNFRTHLKTHSKTQNCYTFSSQARLFLLRSCIECVNNLVTVASEMLTVTINFSKNQQCCSQSTEGSHRVPNPQFLLNIVQKGRGKPMLNKFVANFVQFLGRFGNIDLT